MDSEAQDFCLNNTCSLVVKPYPSTSDWISTSTSENVKAVRLTRSNHGQCRKTCKCPLRATFTYESLTFHWQVAQPTLQQAQTAAILTMLNLNKPTDVNVAFPLSGSKSGARGDVPLPSGPPVWKILVLDQCTKDILATVLRVQDLRDAGITLHVCEQPSSLTL